MNAIANACPGAAAMANAPAVLHLTVGFERSAGCARVLRSRRKSQAHTCIRAGSNISDDVYLLDYGAGNVRSVRNAVKRLGYNLKEVNHHCVTSQICLPHALLQYAVCLQVQKVDDISAASRLIFPGVGAYGQAMDRLKHLGYIDALKDYIEVDHTSHSVKSLGADAC